MYNGRVSYVVVLDWSAGSFKLRYCLAPLRIVGHLLFGSAEIGLLSASNLCDVVLD